MHHSVEIFRYFCHSNFRWNKFGNFGLKTCHFDGFSSSEFGHFGNFLTLSNVEFSQKSKFRPYKMAKIAVFEPLRLQNMISRKICSSEIAEIYSRRAAPFVSQKLREINAFSTKSHCALFSRNFFK